MRDREVRSQLREQLQLQHQFEQHLIVDEMGLCCGKTRVDMAVLNGSLHGYEIKSAQDSVARLPAQRDLYDSVLDYCTIVTAERHLDHARKMLPESWGIWVAVPLASAVALSVEREAAYNEAVVSYSLAQMLWRDELAAELRARDCWRGLSRKPLRDLWRAISEAVPREELRQVVRDRIKERGDWRAAPSPWSGGA